MGSVRASDINRKIYAEDRGESMKGKDGLDFSLAERIASDVSTPKSRQSSHTPEYVKRTAKLFESPKTAEDGESKNGGEKKSDVESFYLGQTKGKDGETVKISLDTIDGESNKKPSYLGVSCSNSGYRNVINYDSKLREGFWSANSQRESLVLCNSRLRESSPLRRDFDFKLLNGSDGVSTKITTKAHLTKEQSVPVNGVGHTEKFINISTSTKTISTFRNSKDLKVNEVENGVNGLKNSDSRSNGEGNVNLRQILNGKNDYSYRRGYSHLGFSPKILKSPEKNCNSFLKSISSFENNCKKSQVVRNTNYSRGEQALCDSTNSIQQRIERLYGPGALAQGFYTQKPNFKTKVFDKSQEVGDAYPQTGEPQISLSKLLDSSPKGNNSTIPSSTAEVVPATERVTNGHGAKDAQSGEVEPEKNGVHFLRLLKKETDRLEDLASFAESELENGENLPEEISGKLRAAAGKARLLVCQKLHQFKGLCQKNMSEEESEPFPTTSEDLAGFWDMVMLQVVQVYGVFDELKELKKNNWKATTTQMEGSSSPANGQSPPARSSVKKSTPTSSSSEKQSQKSEAAKKAREENRKKMLEDRRRKMKELKESKTDSQVEIFAK